MQSELPPQLLLLLANAPACTTSSAYVLMVLRTLALPATFSRYCRDNSLMDYCGRSLECTTLDGWAVYRNRSSQHNVSFNCVDASSWQPLAIC
jgi:hypothetical protein